MALDIKSHYPGAKTFGIDTNVDHLKEAIALAIIDEEATIENLGSADFVIITTPVDVSLQLLPTVLDKIRR